MRMRKVRPALQAQPIVKIRRRPAVAWVSMKIRDRLWIGNSEIQFSVMIVLAGGQSAVLRSFKKWRLGQRTYQIRRSKVVDDVPDREQDTR